MKPLIVANWKCNPTTLEKAKALLNSIKKGVKNIKNIEVVICPPFIYLPILKTNGAQDVFCENAGAYTGQVSPLMLKNMGVEYVIAGHSERRKYQKETDEIIAKKIIAALKNGLKPILCVDKISQLNFVVKEIDNWKLKIENLVIAYEPLFAIGTGKACSLEKAKEMRLAIKNKVGAQTRILYGGSVNSRNAKEFISKAGFQGLLVGGASLNPKEFIDIIKIVC